MKGNKHIQSFNEHQENLNISDVIDSDSSHNYVFQLYGDSEVYDSYEKAHKRLCNLVKKNDDDFKPYKTEKHKGGLAIYYPNGHNIVRWVLQ